MADALLRRRETDVAFVESEGRVALVRLFDTSASPVVLEGTAFKIWNLLDGTRDKGRLIEELASLFDVPAAEVRPGVDNFLNSLDRMGLMDGIHS